MKRNILIVLFYVGIILGTVIINTKFEPEELAYCTSKQLTYTDFFRLLIVRSAEIGIVILILKALSRQTVDYILVTLCGIIAGSISSIRAFSGTFAVSLLYTITVLIILMLYAFVVKIILPEKCDDKKNVFVKLHNSFAGKSVIITIMLINVLTELKILKFF